MTNATTETPPPTSYRRLGGPGRHVERVIGRIAPSPSSTPAAAAACAQLRRGLGREPGSVPEIWVWTVDGLDIDSDSDRATPEEAAVHHALTLYAYHQQSRPVSMHDSERGFGGAVRLLAERARSTQALHETPVYRRFTAMTTASTLREVVVHARGLVGQLRSENLGLDYARFADDLFVLAMPARNDAVRRRWSRDFFARRAGDELSPEHGDHAIPSSPIAEGDQP